MHKPDPTPLPEFAGAFLREPTAPFLGFQVRTARTLPRGVSPAPASAGIVPATIQGLFSPSV